MLVDFAASGPVWRYSRESAMVQVSFVVAEEVAGWR